MFSFARKLHYKSFFFINNMYFLHSHWVKTTFTWPFMIYDMTFFFPPHIQEFRGIDKLALITSSGKPRIRITRS